MTSKYHQILTDLRRDISCGAFLPGQRIPSQYELARKYGVTKETANKAVVYLLALGLLERRRGRGGTVVAPPKQRPCEGIGLLMTLYLNRFYSDLLRGVQASAFRRGYRLQFVEWPAANEIETLWTQLRRSDLLGLLVTHGQPVKDLPFPVVHVNQDPQNDPDANYVNADDARGGYLLGKHLMERGHRDVAYVGKPLSRGVLRLRYGGFVKALAEHGVDHRRFYEVGAETHLSTMAVLDRVLATPPRVTAIACYEDSLAYQGIHFLRTKGIRVPQDISIACFGTATESSSPVVLTAVELHPFTLGEQAADHLIDLVERRCKGPIRHILPVELMQRDTVLSHHAPEGPQRPPRVAAPPRP